MEALSHIAHRLATTESVADPSPTDRRHREDDVRALLPLDEPRRALRVPEVKRRTGLSRTTIWRLVRAKEFPRPHRLSRNAVGWYEDDVDRWLAARPSA